ncbi:hypothetical protein ACPV5S_20130 [Vibrio astriarenae]
MTDLPEPFEIEFTTDEGEREKASIHFNKTIHVEGCVRPFDSYEPQGTHITDGVTFLKEGFKVFQTGPLNFESHEAQNFLLVLCDLTKYLKK